MNIKRLFDIVASTIIIAILSIPMILIAFLIVLTSKGPVIYWSKRTGIDSEIFQMPKFRTMLIGTPVVATHLLKNSEEFLSPIGWFLRRFELDELPQLFMILKGNMSFVGPRPALFNQYDLIKLRKEKGVDKLTPGLTGWAQINGRDSITIPEKVELDFEYLQKKSFLFDLKIIWRTIKKEIFRKDISLLLLNSRFSGWPSYTQEEIDAVSNVLSSSKVNYWTGNECREFEKEFAVWSETKYAVSLANGTLALDVAFKVLNIGTNDEVIVTSRTYISSISSIVISGAKPIFADVDFESQNISIDAIRKNINNNTKAIVCVHLAGWPCEMDEIMFLAEEFGLYVIEDCAQAHGAKYKGKSVGSIGHIGCWSFCQDKIISTGGEGGMVTTNDKTLWKLIWEYKDQGKSYDAVHSDKEYNPGFRWLIESFGSNFRMTEMQAVIGRIQLKRMNSWHDIRLNNAMNIINVTKEYKGLHTPEIPDYIEHAFYKCYLFVKPDQLNENWNRDRIILEINALGVPCSYGTCSEVYLEKVFEDTDFRPAESLPVAKKLGETSIVFLVHPTLSKDAIEITCNAISTVMKQASI